MKILFILPVLTDSYYQKRIRQLTAIGAESVVFGFEREHYEGKSWEMEVTSLGFIEHGNYSHRLKTLFRSIFKIREKTVPADTVYAFSLDTLLIAWIATRFKKNKPAFVYDVADIRQILIENSIRSKLLRAAERFLIRRVKVVVVASPEYISGYFHEIQNLRDTVFHVIENKIDADEMPGNLKFETHSKKNLPHTTIGYFGILRCRKSLLFLKQLLLEANGKYKLVLQGVFPGTEDLKNELLNTGHADYYGTFVYPDDLPGMYKNVDLVWAAHQHGETNTKWARSNRFYQACFFKKPMITQTGTRDDDVTKSRKLGLTINLSGFSHSLKSMLAVNSADLEKWQQHLQQVPEDVYIIKDEYERLLELIQIEK